MALDICFDVKTFLARTCRVCSRYFPFPESDENYSPQQPKEEMQFYRIFDVYDDAARTNELNRDFSDIEMECRENENAKPSDAIKDIYEELVIWKLNIQPNDNLPQQICNDCVKRFLSVKAFREECLDTQKILESYFKDFDNLLETASFGRISPKADSVKSEDARTGVNANKALNDASTTPPRNQRQLSPFSSSPRLMLGSPKFNDVPLFTENSIGTPPPLFEEIKPESCFDLQATEAVKTETDIAMAVDHHSDATVKKNTAAVSNLQYTSSDDESSTPTTDEEDEPDDDYVEETNAEDNDEDDDGASTTSQFTRNSDAHSLNEDRENHLQCKICFAAFNNHTAFQQHRLRAHPQEKPFVCDICTSAFKTNFMLRQHKLGHNRPDTTKCDLCSKYFRSQLHLQRHVKNFHLTSTYTCHICHDKFENYTQMRFQYHVRQHGEKRFQCQHCDKSFHQKIHLLNHTRAHTKEQPFQCSICNKAYRLQSACREHMLTHADPTPFKCKVCFKGFTQRSSLRAHFYRAHETNEDHKRRKTAKKPPSAKQQYFICKFCGQNFSQKLHHEMHQLSHSSKAKMK